MDRLQVMRDVGGKLQHLRSKRGYTQEQIAERVGISTSFYANIERGNKGMSIFVLIELAEAFDVSVDYLLNVEKEGISIVNIQTMLKRTSPAFVSSMEQLIRVCKEEFGRVCE